MTTEKKLVLISLLLGLTIFNPILAQSCTWTFDYDQIHISNITSTNDQNILLLSINDYTNKERTVGFNKTDQKFLEKNLTEQSFSLQDGFQQSSNSYSVDFVNSNNGTILRASSTLLNNTFEKSINLLLTEVTTFFISQKFNTLYVISNTTNYPQNYVLLVTKMDNATTVLYKNFSFHGYFWETYDPTWMVNDQENLFFKSPGCCYCGLGDYYSFSENGLYHIFTADSVAKYTLFDPRSNEFIVATFRGNLTIYNYVSNSTNQFDFDLHTIDTFLSKTQLTTTYYGAIIPLLTVFSLLVLKKRRKNAS